MNRDSQVISKIKPKPIITHIFAPEIIKTDQANFRELVQRLTGKSSDGKTHKVMKTSSHRSTQEQRSKNSESEHDVRINPNGERIKEESEEIFGGENSNCFIDLIELPLLPLKSSHFSKYGGMPLFR